MVTLKLSKPSAVEHLLMVPGYARADWTYQANAAPHRVTIKTKLKGKPVAQRSLKVDLLNRADLYRSGHAAQVVPLDRNPIDEIEVTVDEVRPGRFFKDLCISELIPVLAEP